jgi:hypothetical protein
MSVKYDKVLEHLQMFQERFYGNELNNKILELIKETNKKSFDDGYEQGYINNNPIFDKSLGGFHGDM